MCFSPTLLLEAALGNYPGVIQDFYRGLEQMIDCSSRRDKIYFMPSPMLSEIAAATVAGLFLALLSYQHLSRCSISVIRLGSIRCKK